MNSYFLTINSGKKALTLNLADPKGQEIFKKLIQQLEVDIFVTNQLPKNYEKLGIAYELMKEIKPDIIWLGSSGWDLPGLARIPMRVPMIRFCRQDQA
jgi:formyl-CoA transferase